MVKVKKCPLYIDRLVNRKTSFGALRGKNNSANVVEAVLGALALK